MFFPSVMPSSAMMYRSSFVLLIFVSASIKFVSCHEEHGEWSCNSNSGTRIEANFRPGIITLDGHPEDWNEVDGFEFSLLPALDPHEDDAYKGGKMTVKALHDGNVVYFLLQVDGEYVYSKGNNNKCPSVALMFQVGENATYHNMGGCKESPDACSSKTCKGHEVDIMHFSIGNAIPGRLYGGNPIDNRDGYGGDRFGHLVDVYSWNPHCRYLDGLGPSGLNWQSVPPDILLSLPDGDVDIFGNDTSAQNDWKGAWWHDSFTAQSGFLEEDSPYASTGQKGRFYFEFSRPLRTMDRLQQDVQFTIGQLSKMAVAFWYPVDGNPWHGSGHYSVNCDWLTLDVALTSSALTKVVSRSSWDAASAFSLILSVVSLCLSIFVGYSVTKNKSVPFIPMQQL